MELEEAGELPVLMHGSAGLGDVGDVSILQRDLERLARS